MMNRRWGSYKWLAAAMAAAMLSGCGGQAVTEATKAGDLTQQSGGAENAGAQDKQTSQNPVTNLSQIDMTKWQYQADDKVYYQIGIQYCENPADLTYETLAVFVPADYMEASDNGDGTYTCKVNETGKVGAYTAADAPIVIPVNTPGYSACAALTDYTDVSDYTDAGFIYVHAGCRGRNEGAPLGVTDLKAAIRYIRYNDGVIAGDMDRIFSFGMSGGGAQSALLGSTGDSEMYDDYLQAIGAVEGVSDAVAGSMCWCPITGLDSADEAYEWNMGTSRRGLSDEEQEISNELTAAFAAYINKLGVKDGDGHVLTLETSEDGRYQAGSYYDYIVQVAEDSLNNFLAETTFPYDADAASQKGGMNGGGMGGHGGAGGPGGQGAPDGQGAPGGAGAPDGQGAPDGAGGADGQGAPNGAGAPDGQGAPNGAGAPDGQGAPGGTGAPDGQGTPNGTGAQNGEGAPDGQGAPDGAGAPNGTGTTDGAGAPDQAGGIEARDNITRQATSGTATISGTYETVQDYIDALNADGTWVTYDAATNTASISSLEAFSEAVKPASKGLAAFDQLDASQGENTLFGYGDGSGAHFDSMLAGLLEGTSYADSYKEDLAKEDAEGHTVDYRLNMYSPLYYLMESSEGYQTSNVAKYWRIRSGAWQSDTALTAEVNLALALENLDGVENVDFAIIWGQKHTEAEASGNSTENFISWVNECLAGE